MTVAKTIILGRRRYLNLAPFWILLFYFPLSTWSRKPPKFLHYPLKPEKQWKIIMYKACVINDPLGNTIVTASSYHYSHLKVILFCEIGRTICVKIVITTGRVDQHMRFNKFTHIFCFTSDSTIPPWPENPTDKEQDELFFATLPEFIPHLEKQNFAICLLPLAIKFCWPGSCLHASYIFINSSFL